MSAELIRSFVDDLNTKDIRLLEAWFTDETSLWIPPRDPVTGARRIAALFRAVFRMYDELHWRVTDIYSIGEAGWVYLTDSWGALKGGVPYNNSIVTVIRFNGDGKIVYLSDYFKDTSFGRTS
jgi:ketosteroid isomerase-like protein